jgi:hypothetical protein
MTGSSTKRRNRLENEERKNSLMKNKAALQGDIRKQELKRRDIQKVEERRRYSR